MSNQKNKTMNKLTKETPNVKMGWSVHTSSLLSQVLDNPNTGILHRPLQILLAKLIQVATRASELNDPVLNKLMCDLALYACSNPEDKGYDRDVLDNIHRQFNEYVESEK